MELMNRVRAILDERNISQASFARKIDVSPQVLSGWMMGRRTPGIAELAAMAEELHVSPSYLLTGRDDDPNRQSLVDDDGVCIPLLDVHASCGNGVQLATTTVVKMIKVNHQWINRYWMGTSWSSIPQQLARTPIQCSPSCWITIFLLSASKDRAETSKLLVTTQDMSRTYSHPKRWSTALRCWAES